MFNFDVKAALKKKVNNKVVQSLKRQGNDLKGLAYSHTQPLPSAPRASRNTRFNTGKGSTPLTHDGEVVGRVRKIKNTKYGLKATGALHPLHPQNQRLKQLIDNRGYVMSAGFHKPSIKLKSGKPEIASVTISEFRLTPPSQAGPYYASPGRAKKAFDIIKEPCPFDVRLEAIQEEHAWNANRPARTKANHQRLFELQRRDRGPVPEDYPSRLKYIQALEGFVPISELENALDRPIKEVR